MELRKRELLLVWAFSLFVSVLAQSSSGQDNSGSGQDNSGSDSGQIPTGLEYDDDVDIQEVAAGLVRKKYETIVMKIILIH